MHLQSSCDGIAREVLLHREGTSSFFALFFLAFSAPFENWVFAYSLHICEKSH